MKKFIVVLLAICIIATLALTAKAESNIYPMNAIVIAYETTPWGDTEVTVVDYNGNEYGYFESDANIHIGDMVMMTIVGGEFEEEAEIVDVEYVGTMTVEEIVEWLCH